MTAASDLQNRAINTLRFLSADAVQAAKSGHPGLPMGAAAMAYALWMRHLKFNPRNPDWPDRDRFVLSGGHGSMLLYSLLHLTGYDLPLEELKRFRQWGSKTPGHPESHLTPGVEVTTGPLGQGFGNAVGLAIAEAHLAARFNRPDYSVQDHYTYAIVTDGDLMEGVASEAASLAGHLRLSKLIFLYDDNHISIDGSTDLAFTENRGARFEAYGWHVQQVADGNNVEAVDLAIQHAQADNRPSLIACRTQIGFGLPTKQGTSAAHGEPPGEDELEGAKRALDWPLEPRFYIPEDVLAHFRQAVDRGQARESEWRERMQGYGRDYPESAREFERWYSGDLPANWGSRLPVFPADGKGMATRAASGKVINYISAGVPELVGGSADLTPSNKTWIEGGADFQAGDRAGRYFRFGVREHAMGAIVNGMALHEGLIPYGGTFLVFSDYMRASVRLSAISKAHSIWVYTHDSIGVGEDGPTHQPVEHLAALRAIPGLDVIRPGDANEVSEAWRLAVERRHGPTALILSRQAVPTLDRRKFTPAASLAQGAYILGDLGESEPELILMASGSEVQLIVAAGERLAAEGVNVRLVSFPSWELFERQEQAYQETVLPRAIRARIAIEAGVPQGWHRWVGDHGEVIAVQGYGASAPAETIFEEYGFTVENVMARAAALLARQKKGA
jgi:transketolase